MTRKDYMDGRVSHAEYYRSVYKAAGVSYTNSPLLPQVKQALADGDEHLNTIRLSIWDSEVRCFMFAINAALRTHGDFFSLACGVCVVKQAAKDAANG